MGSTSRPTTVWGPTLPLGILGELARGGAASCQPSLICSEQNYLLVAGASLVEVVQGIVLPIGLQMPGQRLLLLAELSWHLLVHV